MELTYAYHKQGTSQNGLIWLSSIVKPAQGYRPKPAQSLQTCYILGISTPHSKVILCTSLL